MKYKVGDKVVLVDSVPDNLVGMAEDHWQKNLCGKTFTVRRIQSEGIYVLDIGYLICDEHIKRPIRPELFPETLFTLD